MAAARRREIASMSDVVSEVGVAQVAAEPARVDLDRALAGLRVVA